MAFQDCRGIVQSEAFVFQRCAKLAGGVLDERQGVKDAVVVVVRRQGGGTDGDLEGVHGVVELEEGTKDDVAVVCGVVEKQMTLLWWCATLKKCHKLVGILFWWSDGRITPLPSTIQFVLDLYNDKS
ncbi:hypothetical protein PC116_g25013 [Phytophthora cactorum]|uniref:Uncharacterized protein n=1 Tax=Phytophthora cactorum TaxID=29920 RepID=A0A8T1JS29_9STRA|nr:hypothetical protein PC114_g23114 [Phytophthora cactorum]KAG2931525.1 hypothetical protein PC117_g13432 [Phytophthora cactorum]KAG3139644.1 hypothetical protein C6341_g20276 [Phytophthora cactorum]KAG4226586.1 hypothetical protein PC116_g25013 [Phytophthora cactorum]